MLGWLLALAPIAMSPVAVRHPVIIGPLEMGPTVSAAETTAYVAVLGYRELQTSVDVCSRRLHDTVFKPLQVRFDQAFEILVTRYTLVQGVELEVGEAHWHCPRKHRPFSAKKVAKETEVRLQRLEALASKAVTERQ